MGYIVCIVVVPLLLIILLAVLCAHWDKENRERERQGLPRKKHGGVFDMDTETYYVFRQGGKVDTVIVARPHVETHVKIESSVRDED